MKMLKALWDKIKPQAITELVAKEPAIAAGIGAVVLAIATHYGLSLSAVQETYVSGGALLLLNFIVRQVVSPSTMTALKAKHPDGVDDASEQVVIHASEVHVHNSSKPRKR